MRIIELKSLYVSRGMKLIEEGTGKPVITSKNASQLNHVVTQMIEASAATSESEKDRLT